MDRQTWLKQQQRSWYQDVPKPGIDKGNNKEGIKIQRWNFQNIHSSSLYLASSSLPQKKNRYPSLHDAYMCQWSYKGILVQRWLCSYQFK